MIGGIAGRRFQHCKPSLPVSVGCLRLIICNSFSVSEKPHCVHLSHGLRLIYRAAHQLPDEDGLHFLARIRQKKYTLPVLILTARDTLTDKIAGLDVGADDYLVKPFALEELHARIRALLRRHNNQGESELIVGNLTLNMGRRQVWMGGEELILTPKEYALLSRLMLKAGSPVHREILYNDIYNWDNEPSTNTLEVHIHNLRDKVGKARIRTVRGFGYMLVANEEN